MEAVSRRASRVSMIEGKNMKNAEEMRNSSAGCYRITPLKGKRSMKHHCTKAVIMCISLVLTGIIVSCIGSGKLMNKLFGKKEAYLDGTCE